MRKSESMERIKATMKNKEAWATIFNALTIATFTAGMLALILLVYYFVRPIQTADIKVPIATDQATYSPGEPIGGIFFGEVYYKGEVRILREVFCSENYKRAIKPPLESTAPGGYYSTQSTPRTLNGTNVAIGNLPNDIPVGANCVIKFTNLYRINTPFGTRVVEYNYYTQNFSIVSPERRKQLDCEATGSDNCDFTSKNTDNSSSS